MDCTKRKNYKDLSNAEIMDGAIFSWSSEYDAAWVDGCGVELYAKGADGCIESYGMDDEYLAEEISSVIQSNIAETEFLAS